MIVVTGANGRFGRLVTEHLLAAVPASELAVSVRDPAKADGWARQGVRVRYGDFDRPDSLAEAFAGADTVLVNGTNYGTPAAVRAAQQASAIHAAEAAGTGRIVVTSWPDQEHYHLDAADDAPLTESLAARSPVASTVLRVGYPLPAMLARDVTWAVAAGELAAPAGRARTAPPAVDDLAAATANVLTGTGHEDRTYELTGAATIGWDDLASLAGELSGKEVRYRDVTDDEFRTRAAAAGFPAPMLDLLVEVYRTFRAGWAGRPGTDLADLLHRQPVAPLEAVRREVDL